MPLILPLQGLEHAAGSAMCALAAVGFQNFGSGSFLKFKRLMLDVVVGSVVLAAAELDHPFFTSLAFLYVIFEIFLASLPLFFSHP